MVGTVLVICDGGGCWAGWRWAKWLGIFMLLWVLCQIVDLAMILFTAYPAAINRVNLRQNNCGYFQFLTNGL